MTRWYQSRWWYIERPFPWPLIGICATALVAIIGCAVVLGLVLL